MEKPPLVHIVHHDMAVRDSLKALLGSVALDVACYSTAEEYLQSKDSSRPGCLILDLRMPGMSGLELQAHLKKNNDPLPIIFLTEHGTVETSVRAMLQGADHFLPTTVDDETLVEKIHESIERDRRQRRQKLQMDTIRARLDLLTPRETEVMEYVVAGLSNKMIARRLGISHKTVELHRSNMMAKMHAQSVAQLVQMRLSVEYQDRAFSAPPVDAPQASGFMLAAERRNAQASQVRPAR